MSEKQADYVTTPAGALVAKTTQDGGGQKLAAAEMANTGVSAASLNQSAVPTVKRRTHANGRTSGGASRLDRDDYASMLLDIAEQARSEYPGLVTVNEQGGIATITIWMVANTQMVANSQLFAPQDGD